MDHNNQDQHWMSLCLDLARQAESLGEVPVGALVVFDNKLVGRGHNLRELNHQATHHAELLAIEDACRTLGRWRLSGCTLYVTLEPCLMCSGAIINSRVDRVVFGATDPKAGAVVSLYQTLEDPRLNHRPIVTSGVSAEECSQILSSFFKNKRAQIKLRPQRGTSNDQK